MVMTRVFTKGDVVALVPLDGVELLLEQRSGGVGCILGGIPLVIISFHLLKF